MPEDIFTLSAPDLVNLQKWLKRAPREFARAAAGVANTMAFQARREAISNIQRATTTRNARFVSASMRVQKAKPSSRLNLIASEMGSIDLSRQGRSSGFLELEIGGRSKSDRVPTLAARGGTESKKVAPSVRFNRLTRFHRPRDFRSSTARSKQQQTVAMLRLSRARKIQNKPLIIPRGLRGRLGAMPPGIYKRRGKKIILMNPFDGNRGPVRKIAWMRRAVLEVMEPQNVLAIWKQEVDHFLKKRR